VLVVLPAYNETQGLGALLERLDQSMHEDGFRYQIIVVDDGSRDATARIAADHARYMPIHIERHEAVASGSCGGPRPSSADYVMVTGPTDGRPPPEGVRVDYAPRIASRQGIRLTSTSGWACRAPRLTSSSASATPSGSTISSTRRLAGCAEGDAPW